MKRMLSALIGAAVVAGVMVAWVTMADLTPNLPHARAFRAWGKIDGV